MNIHVYTFCYNEEVLIPYFLRYYATIASRIVVFDNESSDNSTELLKSNPNVFVRTYKTGGELRTDIKTALTNREWKRSRGLADWVIVCDMDEFLFHPRMQDMLIRMRQEGFTVGRPFGYDMVGDKLPTGRGQLYEEIPYGVPNQEWDKMILFDPNRIENMNFMAGAHWACPEGDVRVYQEDPELKLLHFRYLGLAYIQHKNRGRRERISQVNKDHKWSVHYQEKEEKLRERFEEMVRSRQVVVK